MTRCRVGVDSPLPGAACFPFNRLKQWRRVATRYEKRADNYLAMLTIAALLLWLIG